MALNISGAIEWAAQSNTPVALLNTVYEANGSVVAEAVGKANLVSARDKRSQQELRLIGVDAYRVPDFSLSWSTPSRDARQARGTIVTDSTVKETDSTLFRLAKRPVAAKYLSFKAMPSRGNGGALGNIKRRTRYQLKRAASKLVGNLHYRSRYGQGHANFEDFVAEFRQAAFVVAGRFHAACMAIDFNIPFCAVQSNSWKMEALMEEAGLTDRLISLKSLEESGIETVAARYGHWCESEQVSMARLRNSAQEGAADLFKKVAALARREPYGAAQSNQ